MFIVIYREHGQLNLETKYIGPFHDWLEAYEILCSLPALGSCPSDKEPGVKFIEELTPHEWRPASPKQDND